MKPQIRFMNQKWLCIIQFDQLRGTNNGIASWWGSSQGLLELQQLPRRHVIIDDQEIIFNR